MSQGATLLIVDDTAVSRITLEALLEPQGYRIVQAQDGPEALALAALEHPDAIVMDVMMPGMDGLATCESLRANPSTVRVPIVLVTALSDLSMQRRAKEVGANAVLGKPVDSRQLREVLRELLLDAAGPV